MVNMKIAHIVSTFPPYRGGMGNVAYHMADRLSSLGHEVTVFTPKYGFKDEDVISIFKVHKLLPQLKLGNSALVLHLFYHLIAKKFDVIHLHYPFMGAYLASILTKLFRRKKTRFVLHYHMDLVGKGWRKVVYSIYNKIFLGWMVKVADAVLMTSRDYLEHSIIYEHYPKYQNKFQILPNGVDIAHFKPMPKSFTLSAKLNPENKKIILFVGALDSSHYFKGVNYLIKAVQLLTRDDFKLIIVGEGDLRPVYEDMVDSFDLAGKVLFTGFVPDEVLVKYYSLCDIFVLPSVDKSEAFGMVLLEAMAFAKPVIASDLPGVREVVERNISGVLCKPKQADQLADKIKAFLEHPKQCLEYGEAGRKTVEEKYSWIKVVDRLKKIYQEQD